MDRSRASEFAAVASFHGEGTIQFSYNKQEGVQRKAKRQVKAKDFYDFCHVHSVRYHPINVHDDGCYIKCKVILSAAPADNKKYPDYSVWIKLSKVTAHVGTGFCTCPADLEYVQKKEDPFHPPDRTLCQGAYCLLHLRGIYRVETDWKTKHIQVRHTAMTDNKFIGLKDGAPGGKALKGCKDMFLEATNAVLHEKADISDIFQYGDDGGDKDCKESIAQFLTRQYGTSVSSDSLILTAGATHGFHFLMTTMMSSSTIVFMEDPVYYMAIPLVTKDLKKTVVPVPKDDEGMLPDVLDDFCTFHKPSDWQRTDKCPHFWATVYFVPIFNNPTGKTYSDARLKQLVAVARKHDVLLVADDLYQFLAHNEDRMGSRSLLHTFDKQTDPDYNGGHLIRNCSFSKLLAPGLRVGWIEAPEWLIDILIKSYVSQASGCFNQYTFKLVSNVLRNGWEQEHIRNARQMYKQRVAVVTQILKNNLPDGCYFQEPKGGFYLWITLLPDTDADKLHELASQKYKVSFVPGALASPSGKFRNYVRLALSAWDEPELKEGVKRFCRAYREYLNLYYNHKTEQPF